VKIALPALAAPFINLESTKTEYSMH